MTRPGYTEIVVLLDRSGSMEPIARDMEGGFNAFMAKQREVKGVICRVSLYQFDSEYNPVYEGLDVHHVPPLRLVPRDMTALYDAVARTINSVGERLARMAEWDRPEKVLFLIITDGMENASKEFSIHLNGAARISEMIKHQREKYAWQFVYLGADVNAAIEASKIGIQVASHYTPSSSGIQHMFMANATATMDFMALDNKNVGAPMAYNIAPTLGEEDPPVATHTKVGVPVPITSSDPQQP